MAPVPNNGVPRLLVSTTTGQLVDLADVLTALSGAIVNTPTTSSPVSLTDAGLDITVAIKAANTEATDADPALVVAQRKGSKTTMGQVSVTGTETPILAANANRKSCTITNTSGVNVFLGNTTGVTVSGYILAPGATVMDSSSTDAWYGITGGTTALLAVIEVA